MSHAQVGHLLAGEGLPFEDTLLEKGKRGGDAIQQGASGGSEGDGPWWPIEELESKLAFEPGDLLDSTRVARYGAVRPPGRSATRPQA